MGPRKKNFLAGSSLGCVCHNGLPFKRLGFAVSSLQWTQKSKALISRNGRVRNSEMWVRIAYMLGVMVWWPGFSSKNSLGLAMRGSRAAGIQRTGASILHHFQSTTTTPHMPNAARCSSRHYKPCTSLSQKLNNSVRLAASGRQNRGA